MDELQARRRECAEPRVADTGHQSVCRWSGHTFERDAAAMRLHSDVSVRKRKCEPGTIAQDFQWKCVLLQKGAVLRQRKIEVRRPGSCIEVTADRRILRRSINRVMGMAENDRGHSICP